MNQHTLLRAALSLTLSALTGCAMTVGAQAPDAAVVGDAPALPDIAIGDAPARPDVPVVPPSEGAVCAPRAPFRSSIRYEGPRGERYDCSTGPMMASRTPVERFAVVTSITDDDPVTTVQVDFCSPAADCIAQPGTLQLRAERLSLGSGPLALRPGQFLRIRSQVSWSFACAMRVEIYNASSWGGEVNPVRHDDALIAAVSQGLAAAIDGAPFGMSPMHIGCAMPGGPSCGVTPEQLALSAQGHCHTCLRDPDPVRIDQGTSAIMQVDDHSYIVRNHMSFETGNCDDYWNYGWSLRETLLD